MPRAFHAPPDPREIARRLPAVEEARVSDVLAAAGGGVQALSVLAAAIARLVATQVDTRLHGLTLGAVGHVITMQLVLRSRQAGGPPS